MADYRSITSSRSYFTLERSVSYYIQFDLIADALESTGGEQLRILEIGGSNNILKTSLENYFANNALGHTVTSLDSDPGSQPDIVGDVRRMDLEDDSFDIVACFEVLEHIRFSEAADALRELRRVARNHLLLSLPHASLLMMLAVKLPRARTRFLLLPLLEPFFLKHRHAGEPYDHHWEIGYRGTGMRSIRKLLSDCGLRLRKDFRNPLYPSHHFFALSP